MKTKRLPLFLLLALLAPWAAQAQHSLTVYEDASYWNNSVPVRGYSANAYQKSQFIIPDELLLDASDCYLNGMSFYMDTPAFAAWTGTFRVDLMDTGIGTSFENNSFFNVDQEGYRVYTGTLDATGSTMNIVFDNPYHYNGGNLLVSVYGSPGLNSWNAYFVGATIPNASLSNYNSTSLSSITTGTIQNFAPKVTFQYISDFIYPRPAFLEASNITGDGATLTWEGNPSYTYMLAYYKASGGSWTTRTVTGTSCTLSSLEPNTTYIVKVRRVVNGEYGSWKGTSFTTNAEPVPDVWMFGFSDWDLINGSSTNAWVHDVFSINGIPIGLGSALGISNDGVTNAYTVTETSTVYAAKLYWFEDAQYQFTIYWKGQGERNYDYMRAALVPASVTLTAGTSPSGFSYNSLPEGWIALDGGNQLCMSTADSTYFGEATVSQVDVTAGNYYMVFAWHNDAFGGTQPPASVTALRIIRETCPVPTNLAVTDITGSSATLSWNTYEEQTHWMIRFKADDDTDYYQIETNENPCVFAGHPDRPLQPQTHYTVSVQAFCGDEHTDWSDEIDFTTGCASFGLPYTYGFEDESDMDCWSMVDCHSSTGRTSYAYHEGERSFRFYYSSNPPQYLISPKFEGTSAMEVSFYYRNQSNSYPETFQVGYSTTTNNPSAFTWGDEVTANDKDTWKLYEDEFPIGTKYVAVKLTSNDQFYLYLDDFSFEAASSCPKPTQLAVYDITTTSATLSWHENGQATSWFVSLGTNNFQGDVSENPYTFTNLIPGEIYFASVTAICDGDLSYPSEVLVFSTAQEPEAVGDDWYGTFQENLWVIENGSCTNAWHYGSDENGSRCLRISNDGGNTYAYNTLSSSFVYVTKLFTFEDGQYYFTTDWKGQGEQNYDYLRIALVPATETLTPGTVPPGFSYNSLPEGWIALDGGSQLYGNADWQGAQHYVDVSAGTYYVVFAWCNDYSQGEQPPAALYSFRIQHMLCPMPTNITVSDITASSVTISWDAYEGQDLWEILYKPDDDPYFSSYLGVETSENPYVLTGIGIPYDLQPNTHYTIMVRALCGEDSVSPFTDEIGFTTSSCDLEDQCEITFELTDRWGDGWNGAYIEVLDAATGTVLGTMTNENLNGITGSGTNEVNIKTLAVCDGRELQFVWHSGSYDSECSYTIYGADTFPYVEGDGAMSDTASFTVDCSMSGCRKPTDVTVSDISPYDASITWTENGTADSWYVFYGTYDGSFYDYFEVYSNSIYLGDYYDEELEPSTTYYLFVAPSCAVEYGDPNTSYSSDVVTFTTLNACPVPYNLSAEPAGYTAQLGWSGYSDSYNIRYRKNLFSEDFEDGLEGWTIVRNGGGTSNTDWQCILGTLNSHGGNYCVRSSSWYNEVSYDVDNWLITPQVTLDGDLCFWVNDDLYYHDQYEVYVSTTTNDINAFSRIYGPATVEPTGTYYNNWKEITIDLRSYNGVQGYIAIRHDDYDKEYIQIDDFSISPEVWTNITTNSYASIEISNLEGNTTYEFQVQGVCDGETTDWSETYTFTTMVLRQTVRTGNWNVAANWDPAGVPTIDEDVIVQHNITVPAGVVAQANNIIEGGTNATRITLEEGAQLVHNRNGNLFQETEVIVKKNITGHGSGNGNWYLITNPSTFSIEPDYSIYGFMSGNYDLYRFDYTGSDKKEWRNYKTTSFDLDVNQSGYLYANQAGTTLNIYADARPSNDRVSKRLSYTTGDYEFPGWHLIGNPFVCNAYLVNSSGVALPYYRMNAEGTDLEAVTSGAIAPMEAIFHNVTGTMTVYFTRTEPSRGSSLNITVEGGVSTGSTTASVDNAIISFGEGEGMEKFNLREDGSKLYIPQGGKDYAVVNMGGDAARYVSKDLNFKAGQDGSYTLSFSCEDVEFSYLHLIDNTTGEDVDLLAGTSIGSATYTFNARITDNANRFRLVFEMK